MSERDDILGLAFLVGGSINNIKQTTLGSGKFVSGGLEQPADFVKKIMAQDISKAIQQPPAPVAEPQQPPNVSSPISATSNTSAVVLNTQISAILNEILFELKKITSKIGV